ncbi:MAG: hypothetical protein V1739_08000, partial [Candidatus Omnitrophota bacterium]
ESIVSQVNKVKKPVYLNWQDDPAVQKLLDVVVGILAEEYIEIAKQNPEIFSQKQNISDYTD